MSRKKELIAFLCLLLALALFCGIAGKVLTPKRHEYGAVWDMYRKEPKNSVDVLFLGTSIAYSDVIPSVLYEETGVASFVMAGPNQTVPITYHYLREACKTQSPRAVFLEANHFLWEDVHTSDKINLTYMPWSRDRLEPAFRNTSGDTLFGLLFPLFAYHDRWDKLDAGDWKDGLLGYGADPLAGYTFLEKAAKASEQPLGDRRRTCTDQVYAGNLDYARKIAELCEEKGVRLIFFLSPGHVQGSEDALREDLLKACPGAEFLDLSGIAGELGIDPDTDYYDSLHFNYRGAEKFTRRLAQCFRELEIAPSGREDAALWAARTARYEALRDEAEGKPIRYIPWS